MRHIAIVMLLAGCPAVEHPDELPAEDLFVGEGVEWWWGDPSCSVVVRQDTAKAAATTHWRDERGEVVRVESIDEDERMVVLRRGYDQVGRLVIEDEVDASTTRWTYDDAGRIVATRTRTAIDADARSSWQYGADGRIAKRTSDSFQTGTLVEEWSRMDDRLERYVVRDSKGAGELSWSYDAASRVLQNRAVAWISGQVQGASVRDYTWAGERIVGVHHRVEPAMAAFDHRDDYAWDDAARLTEHVRRDAEGRMVSRVVVEHGPLGITREAEYDGAGLLRMEIVYDRTPGRVTATLRTSMPRVATIDDHCPSHLPPLRNLIEFAGLAHAIVGLPRDYEPAR